MSIRELIERMYHGDVVPEERSQKPALEIVNPFCKNAKRKVLEWQLTSSARVADMGEWVINPHCATDNPESTD